MEHIVLNWTATPSLRIRNGKDYLVSKCVMLRSGVVPGSSGPLFYSPGVIESEPEMWEGTPVLLNHPGGGDTSQTPGVLERQQLGFVTDPQASRGRLTATVWLDRERLRRLAPSLLAKIEAGHAMEVSAGLWPDLTADSGVHDGIPYSGVVQRIVGADHLALLDEGRRGACSVLDGCGLNVNTLNLHPTLIDDIRYLFGGQTMNQDDYPELAVPEIDWRELSDSRQTGQRQTREEQDQEQPAPGGCQEQVLDPWGTHSR